MDESERSNEELCKTLYDLLNSAYSQLSLFRHEAPTIDDLCLNLGLVGNSYLKEVARRLDVPLDSTYGLGTKPSRNC